MYYVMKAISLILTILAIVVVIVLFMAGEWFVSSVMVLIILLIEFGDRLPKSWYSYIFNKEKDE